MADTHMVDPTKLHGIRCNHPRGRERTRDDWRVTCQRCRSIPAPRETAPENALRFGGVLMHLDRGDERLDLKNVIFVDGGSLVWFEEPNVVAVMHARNGGVVTRYEGEWEQRDSGHRIAPDEARASGRTDS